MDRSGIRSRRPDLEVGGRGPAASLAVVFLATAGAPIIQGERKRDSLESMCEASDGLKERDRGSSPAGLVVPVLEFSQSEICRLSIRKMGDTPEIRELRWCRVFHNQDWRSLDAMTTASVEDTLFLPGRLSAGVPLGLGPALELGSPLLCRIRKEQSKDRQMSPSVSSIHRL